MATFSRLPGASELPLVNRYILILIPLQPYVDWVRGLPNPEHEEGDIELTLDEAQQYHRTSYLVPYSWDWDEVEEWLDENFDLFFLDQLRGIESDSSLWPTRSLEVFDSWFEAHIFDAPLDTTREPMFVRPRSKKKRR